MASSARRWRSNTSATISTSIAREDHIPVHHTNEIAQTEARVGTRLPEFRLHCYFALNDAKMAKSAGEFLRVQLLIDRGYDPLAYRYLCPHRTLSRPVNFTCRGTRSTPRRLRFDRCAPASHALRAAPGATEARCRALRQRSTTTSTHRAR
jgi:cysteinyl-tRNA synthetase